MPPATQTAATGECQTTFSGVDEPEGQQQQAGGTQRDPQDVEGAGFRLPGLRDRG